MVVDLSSFRSQKERREQQEREEAAKHFEVWLEQANAEQLAELIDLIPLACGGDEILIKLVELIRSQYPEILDDCEVKVWKRKFTSFR